jgi:hypothetical protein
MQTHRVNRERESAGRSRQCKIFSSVQAIVVAPQAFHCEDAYEVFATLSLVVVFDELHQRPFSLVWAASAARRRMFR